MAKQEPKPRIGRPRVKNPTTARSFSLRPAHLEAIKAERAEHDLRSDSAALRQILDRALDIDEDRDAPVAGR